VPLLSSPPVSPSSPITALPQNHSNEDIYEKAVAILEAYFDVEDGEEENLAPAVAETGEDTFSLLGAPSRRGGWVFGGQLGARRDRGAGNRCAARVGLHSAGVVRPCC
jgi:hypothetical protein